jgi:hypothetical protein
MIIHYNSKEELDRGEYAFICRADIVSYSYNSRFVHVIKNRYGESDIFIKSELFLEFVKCMIDGLPFNKFSSDVKVGIQKTGTFGKFTVYQDVTNIDPIMGYKGNVTISSSEIQSKIEKPGYYCPPPKYQTDLQDALQELFKMPYQWVITKHSASIVKKYVPKYKVGDVLNFPSFCSYVVNNKTITSLNDNIEYVFDNGVMGGNCITIDNNKKIFKVEGI